MSFTSPPKSQPGPTVNGRATVIHYLSSRTFASSPFVDGVLHMTNEAFHESDRPYLGPHVKRFQTREQMVTELGSASAEQVLSIYILAFAEPSRTTTTTAGEGPEDDYPAGVIGFGSCRPSPFRNPAAMAAMAAAIPNMSDLHRAFMRTEDISRPVPGVMDWSLFMLAVGHQYSRRGLASLLVRMLEVEMRRRTLKAFSVQVGREAAGDWDTDNVLGGQAVSEADVDEALKRGSAKIRAVLSTMQEKNGAFYERRGWVIVKRNPLPAGTEGGANPFHILFMDKMLE